MLRQRLAALDNRVLKIDRRRAELRTEVGRRKQAGLWRALTILAGLELGLALLGGILGLAGLYALAPLGGLHAFYAGKLKAEDDRLNGRGEWNRLHPLDPKTSPTALAWTP